MISILDYNTLLSKKASNQFNVGDVKDGKKITNADIWISDNEARCLCWIFSYDDDSVEVLPIESFSN